MMANDIVAWVSLVVVAAATSGAQSCVELAHVDDIEPGMSICRLTVDGDLDLRRRNLTGVTIESIRADRVSST